MLSILHRNLAARARALTGVKLASAGLGFVMVAVLSNSLEPSAFGQVAMSLSAAALFAVVGGYGQHSVLVRRLPSTGRSEAVRVIRSAFGKSLGLVVALVVLIAAAASIFGLVSDQTWAPFTLFLAVGFALSELASHASRGLGAHFVAVVPRDVFWRLFCILALLVLTRQTAPGLGWTYGLLVSSLALVVALQLALLMRLVWGLPQRKSAHISATDHDRSLWVSSVSALFLAHADSLIVGVIFGPTAAGGYFLVNRMAQFLGFIAVGEHQSISPDIARAFRQVGPAAVEPIAQDASARMLKATVVGWLVVLAMVNVLLDYLGVSFSQAFGVLFWLGAAAIANAAFGPGDIILNMTGHERAACRTALRSTLGAMVLLALGAWMSGITGVAAGVFVATVLRKIMYYGDTVRLLGIRPARVFWTKRGSTRWIAQS